ncbi:MAG: aminopeptidase P family protein, partial [Firmicutes bacterium]|nr:aminopeptidase P family protein [Bacillota bacterium]
MNARADWAGPANVPKSELNRRVEQLQERLQAAQVEAALLQDFVDLYYFTGTAQQGVALVAGSATAADQGLPPPLLLVRRSFSRAQAESGWEQIEPLPSLRQLPQRLQAWYGRLPRRLGLEWDVLPVAQYRFFQELLPGVEWVDVSPLIRALRAVKSPWELERMAGAAQVAAAMFAAARAAAKPGVREIELAAEIEAAGRRAGHPGLVRMRAFNQAMLYGHVLSGPSGGVPSCVDSPTGGPGLTPVFPQGAGWRRLQPDEAVLVDLVGGSEGYLVDQTRMIVLGRLPDPLAQAESLARAILASLEERLRPGMTAAQVYGLAREMAEASGLLPYFMGYGDSQARFVGHGIGLELDEFPPLAARVEIPLQVGMTLAIEPKFVFPGLGAVGIENTYVLTEAGLQRLNV